MAYIERAQDGTIKGIYARPQPGYAEEALADDDPAVQAFQARGTAPAPRNLAAEIDDLKAKLARAEAAEAVLIEKGAVTKGEIDAKVPARAAGAVKG